MGLREFRRKPGVIFRSRRRNAVAQLSVGAMVLCACWLYGTGLIETFIIDARIVDGIGELSNQAVQESGRFDRVRGIKHRHHYNQTNDEKDGSLLSLESFHPENLDISTKVSCGANKCFFRLKKNRQVGYLAMLKRFGSERDWFHEMESSYILAKELEEKYGIQHLLLGPPVKMTISNKLATCMNANLWRESASENRGGSPPIYAEGATAILQKARVASAPHLLIGNSPDKLVMLERHLNSFVASIQDKELFARRFSGSVRVAREVVKEKPCLLRDFQALVDIEGQIYHTDLDRCFEREYQDMEWALTPTNLRRWSQLLDTIEHQIRDVVAGS